MIDFIETKKNYLIALAVLFVIISLSDTTYALFVKSDTTNTFNYQTGLLDLVFTEDQEISLANTFPVDDSVGMQNKPYTLVIKNNGNLTYQFNLKMSSSSDVNSIDNHYIKVKVNDTLPHTLYATQDVIASKIIIKPGQELTFDIRIWLDSDTPNKELGKVYDAKIIASGVAIYKTLDSSGANYPEMTKKMLAVYYDKTDKSWKKADSSNLERAYQWYDYNNQMWANSVILNESLPKVYDLTRHYDITLDHPKINNGDLIIESLPLDIGLSNYSYSTMSAFLKIKLDKMTDKIFFLSNQKMQYFYDTNTHKFNFKIANKTISSTPYLLKPHTYYRVGYTYDGKIIRFYVNGTLLLSSNFRGTISSPNTFKVGPNIILSDIYIYKNMLPYDIIQSNDQDNISLNLDNLLLGYKEFTPMNLWEYYQNQPLGSKVLLDDISAYFVWIPRYKYKVWNVTGGKDFDSYQALLKGIDVVFEKNTESSGTIYCQDNFCYSDSDMKNKVTLNDNDKYYTHPAFRYANHDLSGIWVSKYEVASNLQVKPHQHILMDNSLTTFLSLVKDKKNNYHIIKNSEWGAVTYLAHSKYGICQNNICQKNDANKTDISGNNHLDSTTNNIYGIYDMLGGAQEFTMAHYLENTSKIPSMIILDDILIDKDDCDLYYQDTFILGDATKEINLATWYNQTNDWLARSISNKNKVSFFDYQPITSKTKNNLSSRITIK